ncbi:MAG: Uma2 family endonuclease [Chloroflexaceae bacterium]|jgi:Uma2 family endonuclease|nr:Uma2 family endonuclease [Chloroflexaceae bacterium]
MATARQQKPASAIVYPESDGKPMADNTLQFQWIVTIKENLEALFADNPDVFVAGDLLWYPVEGKPNICAAPDTMVVFGRPKGYRGSYQQWNEGGIGPQVVFEILSPGNRAMEMTRKFDFYNRYNVEEYYLYDPDKLELAGWLCSNNLLTAIETIDGWVSPRLGIRFELSEDADGELTIYRPDGERFLTFVELQQLLTRERQRAEQEATRAEQEAARAEQEAARAEQEAARAEQEAARAEQLAARLRALGIDPDTL